MIALAALALAVAQPACPGLGKPYAGHCVEPEQAVMDLNRCARGLIEWKIGMRAPSCVPCGAKRPTPAEVAMCPEVLRKGSSDDINAALRELKMTFPKHAPDLEEEQRIWELKRDGTCQQLGDSDTGGNARWASCEDTLNRKRLTELGAHKSEYAKTEKPQVPKFGKRPPPGKHKRG